MTCKCGCQNRDGASYCSNCGRSLKRKDYTYVLIFGLIAAIIVAAIGIVLIMLQPNGKTEKDNGEHVHSWQPATCDMPIICETCGETSGKPNGHTWMEATYERPKTCSVCGEMEGSVAERVPATMGMVTAGNYHSVYLDSEGYVYATGRKLTGGGDDRGTRLDVFSWRDIIAISAASHTVGVKLDGTVLAVGVNTYGQCNVDRWTDIIAADAGDNHTVGLRRDGTVVAVGDNSKGQCNVSSWKNIVQVAAAEKTTYGLTEDGRVLSAGAKNYGSSWTDIVAICAGTYHLVGLKLDGTVVQQGSSDYWEGNTDGWYDIVAICAGSVHTVGLRADGTVVACGGKQATKEQLNVGSWYDIVSIGAGMYHTVGLCSDGTIVAVGDNKNQQCDIINYS